MSRRCRGTRLSSRPGVEVDAGRVPASQAGEERHAETDWPGPDHKRAVAGLQVRTRDRMGADREELDACRLVKREAPGRIEVPLRHADPLAHAAVAMHAAHRDAYAAIWLAFAASDAGSARRVGIDEDPLAWRQRAVPRRVEHFARQLMADDPRILPIGMAALVDMIVCAADPGTPDGDQRLIGAPACLRPLLERKVPGLRQTTARMFLVPPLG